MSEEAEAAWLNKPYRDMSNIEIVQARGVWGKHVEDAAGWSSAYFTAKQLEALCAEASRRGWTMPNPYPIKRG